MMKQLQVKVKKLTDRCNAGLKVEDTFFIKGDGKIMIPDNKDSCIYALGSMIPFFTTKLYEDSLSGDSWVRHRSELTCPMDGTVIFEVTAI